LAFVVAFIASAAISRPLRNRLGGQGPGYQVGGRLIDRETSAPLAGTVIATQLRQDGSAAVVPVRVGPDGDFVFRDLAPGRVSLIGVAWGYGRVGQVVNVDPRSAFEAIMSLPRAVEVEGRVVNASGQGVTGAEITVEYARPLGTRIPRESNEGRIAFYEGSWETVHQEDPSGAFTLQNIDPDRDFEIVAKGPTGTITRYPMLAGAAGVRITELQLVLQ
jgi:hypothetical protein